MAGERDENTKSQFLPGHSSIYRTIVCIIIAEVLNVFIPPVGTDPTNLVAIQQDRSAMSITVTWELPTSPTPAGSGFVVIYETAESTNSINIDFCTECGTNISGLMTGSTYSISVITVSAHLPSNRVGPVVVTLGESLH